MPFWFFTKVFGSTHCLPLFSESASNSSLGRQPQSRAISSTSLGVAFTSFCCSSSCAAFSSFLPPSSPASCTLPPSFAASSVSFFSASLACSLVVVPISATYGLLACRELRTFFGVTPDHVYILIVDYTKTYSVFVFEG